MSPLGTLEVVLFNCSSCPPPSISFLRIAFPPEIHMIPTRVSGRAIKTHWFFQWTLGTDILSWNVVFCLSFIVSGNQELWAVWYLLDFYVRYIFNFILWNVLCKLIRVNSAQAQTNKQMLSTTVASSKQLSVQLKIKTLPFFKAGEGY